MTEDEAKTKWCPFTRCEGAYAGGQPTHNRYMRDPPSEEPEPTGPRELAIPKASYCIAAECMAWRWRTVR